MRLASFRCALEGLADTAKSGRNFRFMLLTMALSITAGLVLAIPPSHFFAVLLCCAGALALEVANTAIEHAVDLISPGFHPLAKKAKDCAAGAVLVWSIFCAVIGLAVFLPRVLMLVFGQRAI